MLSPLVGPSAAGAVLRALAVLAAVVPALAAAQQPAATDEFNQAILRYAFRLDGGSVRLVPAQVPDDLAPNFYAPPGTRIFGTVVAGSRAVVLAATRTPPESLRAEYTRALEPRGWRSFENRWRGGFVQSPSERPLVFCREGAQLYVTHHRRPAPPHDLQLEYREGGGMCDAQAVAERVEFVRMETPRFPTLHSPEPPPGRPVSNCYSRARTRGGGSSTSTGALVSSDLPAAELLRYFGRQLEASGWLPPGRRAGPAVVSGTWSRTDSTGTSVITLDVAEGAPGSGCYDVQMKLSR